MKPQDPCCSLKYERMEREEPSSIPNDESQERIFSSETSFSSLSLSSRRKMATSMLRSNDRGSISPLHDGTVGLRPAASRTKTFMPLVRKYSYERPPRTKTSLTESRSTNFSDRSPSRPPLSVNTL